LYIFETVKSSILVTTRSKRVVGTSLIEERIEARDERLRDLTTSVDGETNSRIDDLLHGTAYACESIEYS
jgi:hypothetical protein